MYQPPHFREDDLNVQHALIRAHPLGLLITAGTSGLIANSVPFHLDAGASEKGTLRLHLARANGQWRDIAAGAPVLAVFQGDLDRGLVGVRGGRTGQQGGDQQVGQGLGRHGLGAPYCVF